MKYDSLNQLQAELELVKIRRAEIAAMEHPSQRRDEYIRLAKREAEILGEIEFKFMIGSEMRKRCFQC